ncbi:MAG TPA: class II aldolase/adducin family protein [Tepidisphaeraceae bacterium]|jgi:L-fuculose-phosphate aldolase
MTAANEYEIKQQLCDIGRRIWQKGFCAGNEGNHSYRLGPNLFLCTPTGVSKGNLSPDDLCTVDGSGHQLAGRLKRSSEFLMHAAIYNARPDVVAVIHSHPPHATAFAVAGVDLPTGIHPEAEVFLGPVRMAKYVTPGDHRLAESILPFVQNSNTVLMGNHGVVCFDTDLEQCYYKLEIVDAYARILLLAAQLGRVNTLGLEQMNELIALKSNFGLTDPRTDAAKKGESVCENSEFVSRFGAGRPAGSQPPVDLDSRIRRLIPQDLSPEDMETLVRTITKRVLAELGTAQRNA